MTEVLVSFQTHVILADLRTRVTWKWHLIVLQEEGCRRKEKEEPERIETSLLEGMFWLLLHKLKLYLFQLGQHRLSVLVIVVLETINSMFCRDLKSVFLDNDEHTEPIADSE